MLFKNIEPGLFAFGCVSIFLCTVMLGISIYMFGYLVMGKLQHKSMTLKLILFPILSSIVLICNILFFFIVEVKPNEALTGNVYLSAITNFCQFLLALGLTFLSTELLRILYSLTDFWTMSRVNYLQCFLAVGAIFGFVGLMGYSVTGGLTKTDEELRGDLWQIWVYIFLFQNTILTATYDAVQGLYFVRKLYQLLKRKQSESTSSEQSKLLAIKYNRLCFLIIITFMMDFVGISFGIWAMLEGQSNQFFFRSLTGFGNCQLALRPMLFAITFIKIRELKIVSMSEKAPEEGTSHEPFTKIYGSSQNDIENYTQPTNTLNGLPNNINNYNALEFGKLFQNHSNDSTTVNTIASTPFGEISYSDMIGEIDSIGTPSYSNLSVPTKVFNPESSNLSNFSQTFDTL